tara:strand:+ start:88 stop:531 length:444 start_codon:yes stop_codon:yes gene_type:complete
MSTKLKKCEHAGVEDSCKSRCGNKRKSCRQESNRNKKRNKKTLVIKPPQAAAPSKLLRQIGEDHWKQGEDIMEGKPESKRKPLVVSMKSKCDVDGPDRQLYYVLFPRKDAQENWVRATGYPPDCRDWEHQLLTVEEWGEVSSVFDER